MQVVILCGGSGSRLREETEFKPKPMIQIGGKPMLWHIMQLYSHYGFKDFVLALGYKQEMIKEYFWNYNIINEDIVLDGAPVRFKAVEDWRIVLTDTGEKTMKGGRLKRVQKYVSDDSFMLVYGDAVSNINLQKLLEFHKNHGKLVTVTGVHAPARFGEIHRDGSAVLSFTEKPENSTNLINAGYYVFNRKIFDYVTTDTWCDLEHGPLELIANQGEMQMFEHRGFWQCMDYPKDIDILQQIWDSGNVPWKLW